MLYPRFDIRSLRDADQLVAIKVARADLFTLTRRSVTVPDGWIAWSTGPGRDPRLIQAGGNCTEQDTDEVVFVRATPITCEVRQGNLSSRDEHLLAGTMRVDLRIVAAAGELRAFARNLLRSAARLTRDHIARETEWPMRQGLGTLAGERTAAELVPPLPPEAIQSAVQSHLGAFCLSSGLTIYGIPAVQFESSSYLQQVRDQAARTRANQREQARRELEQARQHAQQQRLDHLATLLHQLQQTAEKQPGVSVPDLLSLFAEQDRQELYAALTHAVPTTPATRFVVAVSGMEVLLLAPGEPREPAHRIALPRELGPLRAVRVEVHPAAEAAAQGQATAFVGAARGVWEVDLHEGATRQAYATALPSDPPIRGGFNAVAWTEDRVFATHSQLGLWIWSRPSGALLATFASLQPMLAAADAVRGVQVADQALWLTIDEQVVSVALDDRDGRWPVLYQPGGDRLSALRVAGGCVWAGDINGQIVEWPVGLPSARRVIRPSTGLPVESIDVLTTLSVDRLIVADRQTALLAMPPSDNAYTRYETGNGTRVRRAVAASDLLAAMTQERDQILLWKPTCPEAPSQNRAITAWTGERIQDLCLVPVPPCAQDHAS